jgi:hypothetical protein
MVYNNTTNVNEIDISTPSYNNFILSMFLYIFVAGLMLACN